eukprot:6069182-Prymnesium_polylepis.1
MKAGGADQNHRCCSVYRRTAASLVTPSLHLAVQCGVESHCRCRRLLLSHGCSWRDAARLHKHHKHQPYPRAGRAPPFGARTNVESGSEEHAELIACL